MKSFNATVLLFSIQLVYHVSGFMSVNYRDLIDKERTVIFDEVDIEVYAPDVSELLVDQPLDHFHSLPNDLKDAVVKQRYFYTSRYVTAKKDVFIRGNEEVERKETYAFLCVGGEGPALDKSVLVDSVHCTGDMLETARRLNESGSSVHVFALEHRYYGSSLPNIKNPRSNRSLKYLSSRQALADLSNFVEIMNKEHDWFGIKWVTFGGSYPGMLSAWARLKFPHLIHASISNSSPVQAIVDFKKYNDHVALAFQNPKVGGSKECLKALSEGHAQVARLLKDGAKEKLVKVAETFNVCDGATPLHDKVNRELFVGDGLLPFNVQSNDPTCTDDLCNIEKICDGLLKSKEPNAMTRLAKLSKKMSNRECTFANWNHYVKLIRSGATKRKRDSDTMWFWQTCTEFGFYQTCETKSNCPYGQGFHNVDQDLKKCYDLFEINENSIYASVLDSLEYYGGWDLKGTRIMFVNGDVDPWSELSVTGDRGSQDQPAYWVKGASHHFWTHKVKNDDSKEIVAIRNKIYEQVVKWIGEDASDMVLTSSS